MIQIRNNPGARIRRAATAFAALALLAGCGGSTTMLHDVWKDTVTPARGMNKILVIAAKKIPSSRRIWEDSFTASLAERGVKAIPSYTYWADALPDTQQVVDVALKEAFDGVLVVHSAHIDTVAEHHEETVTATPVTVQDPWNGFYRTVYKDVYEPEYVEEVKVATQKINFWSTEGKPHLEWTAMAQTYDVETSEKTSAGVVAAVVKALAANKYFSKK